MDASLVVVGSGIKLISHFTIETKAYIEKSDKVLYLVNEPILKKWIANLNSNSESLDDIYLRYALRKHSYSAITEYILKTVYENKHVCVVLYGHPSVFAKPALDAVVLAKQQGYYAKILPGISSEDCLFADLLIDPASHGCLSLEATDFLIHRKKLDTSFHVILWQASIIGMLGHSPNYDNSKGINLLCNYLCEFYPVTHEIISYTASQYPGLDPIIKKFPLGQLKTISLSRISTLYIPPYQKAKYDQKMLIELEINVNDIRDKSTS